MPATEAFGKAIDALGGQKAAAEKIGRSQSTVSGYLKDGNAPADVCMRIEVETNGAFAAEELRPDLADTFRAFRRSKPKEASASKRRRAA